MNRRALQFGTAMLRLGLLALLFFVALPFVQSLWHKHLHAQEVYTTLIEAEHVRIFTRVSDGLICQCGCNFVLSSCPHVECGWGIPARRFIESRILQGMTSDEILEGFVKGFGPGIRAEPIAASLPDHLLEELVQGYGPGIRAQTSPLADLLLLGGVIIVAISLVIYWYRRNRRNRSSSRGMESEADSTPERTESRIDELER